MSSVIIKVARASAPFFRSRAALGTTEATIARNNWIAAELESVPRKIQVIPEEIQFFKSRWNQGGFSIRDAVQVGGGLALIGTSFMVGEVIGRGSLIGYDR